MQIMRRMHLLVSIHVVLTCTAAFAFQSSRRLDGTERIGIVDLPVGTLLWQSTTNSWRAAVLGATVQFANRTLAAGSLIVFDDKSAVRTMWIAGAPTDSGLNDCSFFTPEGTEIMHPQYPTATVPPGRAPMFSGVSPDAPLLKAAEQLILRARSSDREVLPALATDPGGLERALATNDWNLPRFAFANGTFVLLEASNTPVRVRVVLLDEGRLGGMSLAPGTCIHTFFEGGTFAVAGMSSRSPVPMKYQGAVIAPGGLIFWNDDLTPQSYLISEPLSLGPTVFPAGTHISHMWGYVVRPPTPLTIRGVPIDGTAFTHLDGTDVRETWLAAEWEWKPGQRLPEGTHVTLKSGRLETAQLAKPQHVLDLPLRDFAMFYPSGTIAHAHLASPTTIEGVDCAPGFVQFHQKGARLAGCLLAHPHVIGGIKLRPGQFETTEAGLLVRGTLDQVLTVGTSTFQPGEVYNGTFRDSAVLSLLDAMGVDDLERTIMAEFDKLIPEALVRLQESASVMGEYGLGDVTLKAETRAREPHAFVSQRTYEVVDFVDNPPFNDCDCRVELTPQFSWGVKPVGPARQLVATAGLRPNSPIKVGCNFCPTTNLIMPFMSLLSTLSPVPVPQKEIVRKKFESRIGASEKVLIEMLTGKENILPFSFEVEDVFIEGGEMKIKCSFSRTVK